MLFTIYLLYNKHTIRRGQCERVPEPHEQKYNHVMSKAKICINTFYIIDEFNIIVVTKKIKMHYNKK